MDELFTESVPVDLSEAAEYDRTPVKAGEYQLQIADVKFSRSKTEKQTPYLKLRLKVIDEGEGIKGKGVFDNLMLSGKGAFRIKGFLQALGYDEAAIATLRYSPMAVITADNQRKGVGVTLSINGAALELKGQPVRAVLKVTRNDDGTDKNEVSAYLAS